MAEARVSVDLDQFNCSICLDLLTDPVSVNCGHSFCMNCIKTKWDQDDVRGVYSCPLCRKNFTSRPVLGRNTVLAEMVERLKKVHVSDTTLAGPEDVECDVCVERKHKAEKTCLTCLASYCGSHLQLHQELHPGNKHKVIKASARLKERVCRYHNRLRELYCRDEQKCVCSLCVVNHDRRHTVVPNHTERLAKKDEVLLTKQKITQRIQQTQQILKEIKQAAQSFRMSTQAALADSEKSFTEMIHSLERSRSEVSKRIQAKEKAEVLYAEKVQKQLELEIAALEKRGRELDELPQTEDDTYFIQTLHRLQSSPLYNPLPIAVRPPSFEKVKKSVTDLRNHVKSFCAAQVAALSTDVGSMKMIYSPLPLFREEFLQYFHQPALNLNSVSWNLGLSENNSKLTCSDQRHSYPDHPERYTYMAQALCEQGLSGRSYWEVEWHGPQVYVGISYKGVDRKGCSMAMGFGHNSQSWSLCCSRGSSFVCHDDKATQVFEPISSRIGIYLDTKAGTLSFYNVSDMMTLLHTFQAVFKEPLYPGFWVFDSSDVRICQHGEKVSTERDKKQKYRYCNVQFKIWQDQKALPREVSGLLWDSLHL